MGKHLIVSQESAGGTHLGKLELCTPSNKIGQAHLYSWQPVQANSEIRTYFKKKFNQETSVHGGKGTSVDML